VEVVLPSLLSTGPEMDYTSLQKQVISH